MPYEQLDRVRITEASLAGADVRIVAELGPAYASSLGLTRVTRTFTFDGALTIRVADEVEAARPQPAEWRLHSDHPFAGGGARYALEAGLEVELAEAAGARGETGTAWLKSPGPPGSIEQGRRDKRGYELVWSRDPAARHSFDVLLRLR
jgi:hypothetical protein